MAGKRRGGKKKGGEGGGKGEVAIDATGIIHLPSLYRLRLLPKQRGLNDRGKKEKEGGERLEASAARRFCIFKRLNHDMWGKGERKKGRRAEHEKQELFALFS